MSGTNPDGSHYSDPGVPWVSYFNGGDALHGFLRASYGSRPEPRLRRDALRRRPQGVRVHPDRHARTRDLAGRHAGRHGLVPWRIASTRCTRRNGQPRSNPSTRIWRGARSPRRPAARTRSTPSQFAGWATSRDLGPAEVGVRDLRRYLAALSESGRAPSTIARKLAVLRGLLRVQTENGLRTGEPGGAAQLAEAAPAAAAGAEARRGGGAARPDPGDDAARAARPGAVRARVLVGPARRGARVARRGVDRLRRGVVRVEGKGSKTRLVPVGEHARARARAVSRARPPGARCCKPTRAVPVEIGPEAVDVRRAPAAADLEPAGDIPRSRGDRRASARVTSLFRDSFARGRRRPESDSGTARPRIHLYNPGLHSGRVAPIEGCLRTGASSGVTSWGLSWKRTSKRSSSKTSGGVTRRRATSGHASGSWSRTRRWSSTSRDG